jgi:hypothetical protein
MLAYNIKSGVQCSNDDDDGDDDDDKPFFLYLDRIIPAIRMLRRCFF